MHQRAAFGAEPRLAQVEPGLPFQQLANLHETHHIIAVRADGAKGTAQHADDHQAGNDRCRQQQTGMVFGEGGGADRRRHRETALQARLT